MIPSSPRHTTGWSSAIRTRMTLGSPWRLSSSERRAPWLDTCMSLTPRVAGIVHYKAGTRHVPRALHLASAFLLLFSFALANPAGAPKYVSRVWRTQDGLPESRIRAIAQTPDGYLWIATPGGLARFDGVRFVVYSRTNTPSMTDENIRALGVARDGSLWIATDGGGLLHYRDGSFRV